jgi:hypothetical protein
MKRFIFSAAVAAAILLDPTASGAQCLANGNGATCNQTGSVSMTAGRVIRLQMSANSTTLTPPVSTDFDAGLKSTTGPSLTVSSNSSWTLYLRSSTAVWAATNTSPGAPARVNKPAADLKWAKVAGGPFTALTTADVSLATGPATASSITNLFFQTLYNWTLDTPGNYSLAIVLTLTSP